LIRLAGSPTSFRSAWFFEKRGRYLNKMKEGVALRCSLGGLWVAKHLSGGLQLLQTFRFRAEECSDGFQSGWQQWRTGE
jgi:hypothetical protein